MSDGSQEAQLDVIANRLFDAWNQRARAAEERRFTSLEAKVAKLEADAARAQEIRITRDREIKDIKHTVGAMDSKIDTLVADKAGRDTAISVAKWLVGSGFIGIVGSVIVATLHYIGVLRPPA